MKSCTIVLATLFLGNLAASGSVLITSPGGASPITFRDTVGFSFTVGASPLNVTSLGVWDSDSNGLLNGNQVGLWNLTGILLGSVSIPAGSSAPLLSQFRYVNLLNPITLESNTTYVLGAFAVEDRTTGVTPPTFSGDASLVGTRRSNNFNSFIFPGESGSFANQAIVGPNMQYAVIPEPSLGVVFLVGSAGLAMRRKTSKVAPLRYAS